LLGEDTVVIGVLRRQLDGDERVAEETAQRREPVAHQLVAGETQSEHLTAIRRALGDNGCVVG